MEMTQRELLCANDGYRVRQKEEWEKVRVLSWYATSPYHPKHGLPLEKVWIPTDEVEEIEVKGGRVQLTRDEIREEYRRAGIKISEAQLDKICQ